MTPYLRLAKSYRKTASIRSLQRLLRTTAELKQQISQRYYFAAQWHFGDVVQSNIIVCDICCFRSASLLLPSLKGVVNCEVYLH